GSEPPHEAEDNGVSCAEPALPSPPRRLDLFLMLGDELAAGLRPLAPVNAAKILARQLADGGSGKLAPISPKRHWWVSTIRAKGGFWLSAAQLPAGSHFRAASGPVTESQSGMRRARYVKKGLEFRRRTTSMGRRRTERSPRGTSCPTRTP